MKYSALFGLVFLSLIIGYVAGAQNPDDPRRPLSGMYRIAGPLQFGDIEEGKSHLFLYLEADSAKALYQALSGKPVQDGCTGGLTKTAGQLVCSSKGSAHSCNFSVDLKTLEIGNASTC